MFHSSKYVLNSRFLNSACSKKNKSFLKNIVLFSSEKYFDYTWSMNKLFFVVAATEYLWVHFGKSLTVILLEADGSLQYFHVGPLC